MLASPAHTKQRYEKNALQKYKPTLTTIFIIC